MATPCSKTLEIKECQDGIKECKTNIGKILGVLLPDELHPDNGLINQMVKTREDVGAIKKTIDYAKAYITGAIAIIILLVSVIQFAVNHFERKSEAAAQKQEMIEAIREVLKSSE